MREELSTLAKHGDGFRRLVEPKRGDVLFPLATFLQLFDIGTVYPLLLHLLDSGLDDAQWRRASEILESYVVRRAVCGLPIKNYNRLFLSLTRHLRKTVTSAAAVEKYLAASVGESGEWPRDEKFLTAWRNNHVYQTLQNPKVVHILRRLSDTYFTGKTEDITINAPLSVEHILPQSWLAHWPLPDGTAGYTQRQVWDAADGDKTAEATNVRNAALQTFGNLTIVSQALNSSLSNGPWPQKKEALLNASLLPINQQLSGVEVWNEDAIDKRSSSLSSRALKIWPGPPRA